MRKFAPLWVVVAAVALSSPAAGEKAPAIPSTIGYTFYVDGKRVGRTDIRVTQSGDALRFTSKLRVDAGPSSVELTTQTEADPATYALRTFAYQGTKGGTAATASVTVAADSVFGAVSFGGPESERGRRVNKGPAVVWEDWVMDLEILLARQQAREQTAKTRDLVLAGSFSLGSVTLGYSGEVLVESQTHSVIAKKLLVAIQGGDPFESMIHPELGIPVYIRFPVVKAEVFLDQFYGDNPVSFYVTRAGAPRSP